MMLVLENLTLQIVVSQFEDGLSHTCVLIDLMLSHTHYTCTYTYAYYAHDKYYRHTWCWYSELTVTTTHVFYTVQVSPKSSWEPKKDKITP